MKKVVVEQSQQEMAAAAVVEAFGCGDKIYTFFLISHRAKSEKIQCHREDREKETVVI